MMKKRPKLFLLMVCLGLVLSGCADMSSHPARVSQCGPLGDPSKCNGR
jgi:outer membrane lipoprotein-sorting protein